MKRALASAVLAVLLLASLACSSKDELILATTTSTQDSGLLDVLIPMFEDQYDYDVKTIAVGSGQALEMGAKGEADVILAHSPKAEEEFMAAGNGESREAVMHNDFIIVGPADDPAGIAGAESAAEAMALIAEAEAPFGRGDDWHPPMVVDGGGDRPSGSWYQETGQGWRDTKCGFGAVGVHPDRPRHLPGAEGQPGPGAPGRGRQGALQQLHRHRREPGGAR
jgi:tungstate transport system substrate-binding protein